MVFEPILDHLGPMAQFIILLEYPIIVGVYEIHEGLQMITSET